MSRQQLEAYLRSEGVSEITVEEDAFDLFEVAAAARAKGYDVTDEDIMSIDNPETITVEGDTGTFLRGARSAQFFRQK